MSSVNYAAALKRAPPPTSTLTSASNKKKKKKKVDVTENNRNKNEERVKRNAVNHDDNNANRNNNKWLSTPGNAKGPPAAILSKPRQPSSTTTNAWKKIPSIRNPSVNPRQQQPDKPNDKQHHEDKPSAATTTTTKTTKKNKQPATSKPAFSKKPKPSSGVVLGDVIMRQVLQQKSSSSSSSSSRQPKGHPLSFSASLLSTTNPSKTKRKKLESNNTNTTTNHKPSPKTPRAVNNTSTSTTTTGTSLLQTFGAKQRTDEEANLFGKFATTTFSKGRQRLQPLKKKFSTLKKKILQERLDQWRALNPNPDLATTAKTEGPETSSSLGRVVALPHFVHPEEDNLQDDDEYQELLDNLTELATKVGTVQTVVISRNPAHEGIALVCFDKPADAAAAKACWEGLVLGGVRLQPEFVLHDASLDMKEDTDDGGNDHRHQEMLMDAYIAQCQRQKEAAAAESHAPTVVILDNILTQDDFEDDDCLQESLHDIQAMAEKIGQVLRVEETNQRVHLTYADGTVAQHAVQQFHQRVVGGQVVSARLQETTTEDDDEEENKGSVSHAIVLYDLLTEDDLEDEDCLEESKADTTALASQFGSVVRIDVDLDARTVRVQYAEPLDVVEKAAAQFNGMVFGGQRVRAVLDRPLQDSSSPELLPNPAEQSKPLPPLPDAKEEEKKQIMYSGDKIVSERFAECKRVPKVPNAGVPRKYATLTDDETVKPLLSAMLGELMRLQKRAVEDKNAKARRRLVMGLREVARGIRSHKVKLVVMANNLDQYGALDDKLQEILDLAGTESVPVFFEFSKRSLGKAVGKTIKIAVIGVQNADGAHQQFKKLLQIAASH